MLTDFCARECPVDSLLLLKMYLIPHRQYFEYSDSNEQLIKDYIFNLTFLRLTLNIIIFFPNTNLNVLIDVNYV